MVLRSRLGLLWLIVDIIVVRRVSSLGSQHRSLVHLLVAVPAPRPVVSPSHPHISSNAHTAALLCNNPR